jgi:hypothetical protein
MRTFLVSYGLLLTITYRTSRGFGPFDLRATLRLAVYPSLATFLSLAHLLPSFMCRQYHTMYYILSSCQTLFLPSILYPPFVLSHSTPFRFSHFSLFIRTNPHQTDPHYSFLRTGALNDSFLLGLTGGDPDGE